MNSDFDGNVGNIKNIIKYACGNAYVHQKQKPTVQIKLLICRSNTAANSKKILQNLEKFQRSALFAYGSEQKSFKHEQQRSADPIFDEMFLEFTEVINDNKNFKEYMNRLSKKVTRIMDAFIFKSPMMRNTRFIRYWCIISAKPSIFSMTAMALSKTAIV